MKIVLVTQHQFDWLWQKLQPQQRIMVDELMSPAISLKALGLNALVVVRGAVELAEYPETEDMRIRDIIDVVAMGRVRESAAGAA
jgi:hypothetical protein